MNFLKPCQGKKADGRETQYRHRATIGSRSSMQKTSHPMSTPNASLVVCKGKKGKVKAEKNKKGYL
jgi:hypothetical protein